MPRIAKILRFFLRKQWLWRILRGDEQQHSQRHSAPIGSQLVNTQSHGGLLPACVLA